MNGPKKLSALVASFLAVALIGMHTATASTASLSITPTMLCSSTPGPNATDLAVLTFNASGFPPNSQVWIWTNDGNPPSGWTSDSSGTVSPSPQALVQWTRSAGYSATWWAYYTGNPSPLPGDNPLSAADPNYSASASIVLSCPDPGASTTPPPPEPTPTETTPPDPDPTPTETTPPDPEPTEEPPPPPPPHISRLQTLAAHPWMLHSLAVKLNAAIAALERGNTMSACGSLGAFANELRAVTGKKVSVGHSALWGGEALAVAAELGC